MWEYAEYQVILQDHQYYSSIYFDDFSRVSFKKALEDTLKKWEFVTKWVTRWDKKSVKDLKERPESPRITEIMNLDEPLCFEDLICQKREQRCACCPLWHITGYPCEDPKSAKYNLLKDWRAGEGYFHPHLFATVLRKLKYGNPLYDYDVGFLKTSIYY